MASVHPKRLTADKSAHTLDRRTSSATAVVFCLRMSAGKLHDGGAKPRNASRKRSMQTFIWHWAFMQTINDQIHPSGAAAPIPPTLPRSGGYAVVMVILSGCTVPLQPDKMTIAATSW